MHIFIYQTKKNILYLKHIMLAEYLSILSKYFDRSYSGKIIIQRNIIISSIDLKHSCNLYLFSYFIILYFIYLLVFCMQLEFRWSVERCKDVLYEGQCEPADCQEKCTINHSNSVGECWRWSGNNVPYCLCNFLCS